MTAMSSLTYTLKNLLIQTSEVTQFILRAFKEVLLFVKPPYEYKELIKQAFKMGNKSLFLVLITGFIMGLVLTIQSRPVLAEFGATSWLPSMVSISFIREIGPVITALICAGKIGSGIGAEVGSMKVTEQIEAMEVSATNPFKFIVATRVIACTMVLPLLVMFSNIAGMLGCYVGINMYGDLNLNLFFAQAFSSLEFADFFPSVIKSMMFGLTISIVGCHRGMMAGRGTESVGIAANSAVVISSLLIFLVDLIVVQITSLLDSGSL